ncbi:MAG: hypothetical protein KDD64_14805 [Bdellovibrionales bacterium]|nr:hypothetical protein [Bdellovibrionales bacterium]
MPRRKREFKSLIAYSICSEFDGFVELQLDGLLRELLMGVLTRAQELYPVKVSHFGLSSKGFQIVLCSSEGENVSRFMGYFKGELSRSLVRIGRLEGGALWGKRYSAEPITSVESGIEIVSELYLNAFAHTRCLSEEKSFPCTSWDLFLSGQSFVKTIWIPNRLLTPEVSASLSRYSPETIRFSNLTEQVEGEPGTLHFDPNAWMPKYSPINDEATERARLSILRRVAKERPLSENPRPSVLDQNASSSLYL